MPWGSRRTPSALPSSPRLRRAGPSPPRLRRAGRFAGRRTGRSATRSTNGWWLGSRCDSICPRIGHVARGQALGRANDFRRPCAALDGGAVAARPLPPKAFALVKNWLLSQILFMRMTLDQIVEETRNWPAEQVGELVDRLTEGLHASSPEIEAAWKTEIDRRIAEIESGKVQGVSPEVIAGRIQKILGR